MGQKVRRRLVDLARRGKATDLLRVKIAGLELRVRPSEGSILRGLAGAIIASAQAGALRGLSRAERNASISDAVRELESTGGLTAFLGRFLEGDDRLDIRPEGPGDFEEEDDDGEGLIA